MAFDVATNTIDNIETRLVEFALNLPGGATTVCSG